MVSLLLLQSGICGAGEGRGKDQHGRLWVLKEEEERSDTFTGKVSSSFPCKPPSHPWTTWVGAQRRSDEATNFFMVSSRTSFPLDLLVPPWRFPAAKIAQSGMGLSGCEQTIDFMISGTGRWVSFVCGWPNPAHHSQMYSCMKLLICLTFSTSLLKKLWNAADTCNLDCESSSGRNCQFSVASTLSCFLVKNYKQFLEKAIEGKIEKGIIRCLLDSYVTSPRPVQICLVIYKCFATNLHANMSVSLNLPAESCLPCEAGETQCNEATLLGSS